MIARTVVYDAGMLVALLRDSSAARLRHHGLRAAPHRPVVIGPVLAQAWRPDPKTVHAFSQYLKDCTVPQTRETAPPIRVATSVPAGCVACARIFTLDSYKRAGVMLADARFPAKKRADVIDALVVIVAALHGPAQILTSDPDGIAAYAATLARADIVVEAI
ncbi:conserved hypothetical protein [Frankia canadensis]|uniref:PIN domain-containing protein n=1 Tax=Frankia canadensis TaxID=1836972 RepID=A0A2I2L0C9_9ACTN|nr:hypothetical protein [Frankia canadensis]SNQ51364.1 conserved hypothetical protein [Frankia canadensis]SOU58654.1 conserved hypothetical protein [Frankia canadensis]